MGQDTTNQIETIYEINNKRYKVIAKCIEQSRSIEEIYDVLCRFAISILEKEVFKDEPKE